MYRELNPASKAAISVNDFATAYREAELVATLRSLEPGSAHDPDSQQGETVVPVPISDRHRRLRPARRRDRPALRRRRHRLGPEPRLPRAAPRRAPRKPDRAGAAGGDPRRDGTPLAEGPADAREHPLGSAAIDVTGEVGRSRRRRPAGAGPARLRRRHPGRRQRPRAGLQRPPGGQAGGLAAGPRRSRRLGPGPRPVRTPARRPGEDDDRPRNCRNRRSRPWPGAPAASPSSTPATATSAPSPARPSRPPSRPARPSR